MSDTVLVEDGARCEKLLLVKHFSGTDLSAVGFFGRAALSSVRESAGSDYSVPVRVVLVTGGNRGIGFEVCRQLGRLDYEVLLGARDPAKGEKAAEVLRGEGLNVTTLKLDVTREEDVARLGELERVDALVNNAAIMPDAAAESSSAFHVPAETVLEGFRTNTLGPYRVCQQIVPIMRRQGYGRIVNVATGLAQLGEMNGHHPAYRLSKTALNALTRVLADELKGMNILVNSVDPGWVKTDMGGPGAVLTPEQGAETIVWAATLPDVGPTGGFFKEKRQIAW